MSGNASRSMALQACVAVMPYHYYTHYESIGDLL